MESRSIEIGSLRELRSCPQTAERAILQHSTHRSTAVSLSPPLLPLSLPHISSFASLGGSPFLSTPMSDSPQQIHAVAPRRPAQPTDLADKFVAFQRRQAAYVAP